MTWLFLFFKLTPISQVSSFFFKSPSHRIATVSVLTWVTLSARASSEVRHLCPHRGGSCGHRNLGYYLSDFCIYSRTPRQGLQSQSALEESTDRGIFSPLFSLPMCGSKHSCEAGNDYSWAVPLGESRVSCPPIPECPLHPCRPPTPTMLGARHRVSTGTCSNPTEGQRPTCGGSAQLGYEMASVIIIYKEILRLPRDSGLVHGRGNRLESRSAGPGSRPRRTAHFLREQADPSL